LNGILTLFSRCFNGALGEFEEEAMASIGMGQAPGIMSSF